YTADADYNGPDSFTYTVTSPTGVTETATVNVTVTAVADIVDNSVTATEDTPLVLTAASLLANDNFEGSPVVSSVGTATHGTVSLSGGNITYTADADYNGPDSFTYTVTSPTGVTETATVNVTVTAVADIVDNSVTATEDTPLVLTAASLLANDNFEGSPVVSSVGTATHGTVSLSGGNITYTADADYNGPDSFTYTVTSPTGVTETATVNVTVTAVADIVDNSVTATEDTPLVLTAASLLANDNFEGSPVVSSVGTATPGTVSLSGGNITYTADAD